MTKYNWETIKKQYIYGIRQENGTKTYPTYKELSKIHGCAQSTLGDRAKKEEWKLEKQKISEKIGKKVAEKKTELEAEEIVQSNEEYRKGATLARKTAVKKLKQLNKDMDNPKTYVRAYDIKMATDALSQAQTVDLTAHDEVTKYLRVDSDGNVKVSILDDDFQERELEFMKKLVKKD